MSSLAERMRAEERDARVRGAQEALEETHGDVPRAAALLQVSRATLYRWLDEYEELGAAPRRGRGRPRGRGG